MTKKKSMSMKLPLLILGVIAGLILYFSIGPGRDLVDFLKSRASETGVGFGGLCGNTFVNQPLLLQNDGRSRIFDCRYIAALDSVNNISGTLYAKFLFTNTHTKIYPTLAIILSLAHPTAQWQVNDDQLGQIIYDITLRDLHVIPAPGYPQNSRYVATLLITRRSSLTTVSVAPKFYIYNLTNPSRNPAFQANDRIRFAASATPNKSLKSCYEFTRVIQPAGIERGCDLLNEHIGSTGIWTKDSQVIDISAGTWKRWVEVDGVQSNPISYTVTSAAPRIIRIVPTAGQINTVVALQLASAITAQHLTIHFGTTIAHMQPTTIAYPVSMITFTVPTILRAGTYDVWLTNDFGESNHIRFTITGTQIAH